MSNPKYNSVQNKYQLIFNENTKLNKINDDGTIPKEVNDLIENNISET